MVHFENNYRMSLNPLSQETKHGTGKIICAPQTKQNTPLYFYFFLTISHRGKHIVHKSFKSLKSKLILRQDISIFSIYKVIHTQDILQITQETREATRAVESRLNKLNSVILPSIVINSGSPQLNQ